MFTKKGFTLIELMIVVAVIAVLVAIAYPSYISYVQRTKRVEVQSEMMQIAQHLQSYYLIHHNFTSATLFDGSKSVDYPSSGDSTYNIVLIANDQTWTLTATAQGAQSNNGSVVLNNEGQKCWIKGMSCIPSSTTNWDGK